MGQSMPRRGVELAWRFGFSLMLSVLVLTLHTWLTHRGSTFQGLNLFAAPIAIGVGLIPLLRWYRRDAYPVGLAFALVTFLVLKWVSPLLGTLVH